MGTVQSNTVYKEIVNVFAFDRETPLEGLNPTTAFSLSFYKNSDIFTDSVATSVVIVATL